MSVQTEAARSPAVLLKSNTYVVLNQSSLASTINLLLQLAIEVFVLAPHSGTIHDLHK